MQGQLESRTKAMGTRFSISDFNLFVFGLWTMAYDYLGFSFILIIKSDFCGFKYFEVLI